MPFLWDYGKAICNHFFLNRCHMPESGNPHGLSQCGKYCECIFLESLQNTHFQLLYIPIYGNFFFIKNV